MKRLREKLRDERGASLIIALLFFLVCIMVASVIVTAAAANAGRIEKYKDEQQAYLAASSAARLLRDDMAALTGFTATRRDVRYSCPYPAEHQGQTGQWEAANSGGEGKATLLGGYVHEAALAVLKTGSGWSHSFTLNADTAPLSGIPVTVEATMDQDFGMKLVCTATTEKGSAYSVTLSVSGSMTQASAEDRSEYCTHQKKSDDPVLVNGEWTYPMVNQNYPIIQTTYTAVIVWSPGTLSKGG